MSAVSTENTPLIQPRSALSRFAAKSAIALSEETISNALVYTMFGSILAMGACPVVAILSKRFPSFYPYLEASFFVSTGALIGSVVASHLNISKVSDAFGKMRPKNHDYDAPILAITPKGIGGLDYTHMSKYGEFVVRAQELESAVPVRGWSEDGFLSVDPRNLESGQRYVCQYPLQIEGDLPNDIDILADAQVRVKGSVGYFSRVKAIDLDNLTEDRTILVDPGKGTPPIQDYVLDEAVPTTLTVEGDLLAGAQLMTNGVVDLGGVQKGEISAADVQSSTHRLEIGARAHTRSVADPSRFLQFKI